MAIDLAHIGPLIEHNPIFPERVNLSIVQRVGDPEDRAFRMRVWERGVGVTEASGSGACAGALASMRRGLTDRSVDVHLDGGLLTITWREDNQVVMTGPTAHAFTGRLDEALLA